MCGIAGVHRRTDAVVPKLGKLVDALLVSIESRGRDATGCLAMLPNGKVQIERATVPASRFVRGRKALRNEARTVLLHTRFATVGAADDPRNAHPVVNGRMAAVHNGTIYNHRELFRTFGLKRHAEVDSEIIPALLDFAGWDQAHEAIDLLRGGAAFAAVHDKRPDEVILARTETYPLHYYVTPKLVVWASTREAITRAWRVTYGGEPRGGSWHTLAEWSMVRINGKLDTTTIRKAKPVAKAKPTKAPKRGKRSRRHALPTPRVARIEQPKLPPMRPAYQEREPWMEEAVRDLMRIEGMSYAQAFDAVYGVEPEDGEEWIEDLIEHADSWWLA